MKATLLPYILFTCMLILAPGRLARADQEPEIMYVQYGFGEPNEFQPDRLRNLKSQRLTRALSSPDLLWEFLLSPKTDYAERLAVTYQGVNVFPVKRLPELMRAIGVLNEGFMKTHWGLKPHPQSASGFTLSEEYLDKQYSFFGHTWVPPRKDQDYPITAAQLRKSPWPFQVQNALEQLFSNLSQSRVDGEWLAAVRSLPCRTDREARLVTRATYPMVKYYPVKTINILRNIILNPDFEGASYEIPWVIGSYASRGIARPRKNVDPKLAMVVVYEALQNSPHAGTRDTAGRSMVKHTGAWLKPEEEEFPFRATAIDLLIRKALDPQTNNHVRHVTRVEYAASAVRLIRDNPPYKVEIYPSKVGRDRSKKDIYLRKLRIWYDANREELANLVQNEAAEIEGLKSKLTSEKLCAS